MKALITIIFLLIHIALAEQYEVDHYSLQDGLDFSYILKNSQDPSFSINVDCQSFFQKFDIYKEDKLLEENYITINECQEIMQFTDLCLQQTGKVCYKSEIKT